MKIQTNKGVLWSLSIQFHFQYAWTSSQIAYHPVAYHQSHQILKYKYWVIPYRLLIACSHFEIFGLSRCRSNSLYFVLNHEQTCLQVRYHVVVNIADSKRFILIFNRFFITLSSFWIWIWSILNFTGGHVVLARLFRLCRIPDKNWFDQFWSWLIIWFWIKWNYILRILDLDRSFNVTFPYLHFWVV